MVIGMQRSYRAFTLFELVVVTFIISIIGLMAIPIIGAVAGGPRVETAANQLLADIEYCQSMNIARTDSQFAIRFNKAQNFYQIEALPGGSATASVIHFPGDRQPYINDFATGRNQHLTGVSLGELPENQETYWLTFNRYGQPQTQSGRLTQNVQIPLEGGGRTLLVSIEWDTGEISITK